MWEEKKKYGKQQQWRGTEGGWKADVKGTVKNTIIKKSLSRIHTFVCVSVSACQWL